MTKKLTELSGSILVLSASMILILAFLISHVSMPKIQISRPHPVLGSEPITAGEAKADATMTELAPIPQSSDFQSDLDQIYESPSASLTSATLGLNASAEKAAREVISSVLAVSQSADNFEVTTSVSPEEYEMLLYCVGHETRSGSLCHKMLITQVILNRVQGPKFGSSVREVVLAPGQFDVMAGYEGWGDWTPDETTRQAVSLVLSGSAPDYSHGAVYFCNPYLVGEGNWFDMTRQAVCELEGHRFYR